MMRRSLAAGILIALLLQPATLAAQSSTLYEDILESVRSQSAVERAESTVRHFVAAIFRQRWKTTVRDVNLVLQGNWADVCAPQCTGANGLEPCAAGQEASAVRKALYAEECRTMVENVRRTTEGEEFIRAFGRRLQVLATGQETMIADGTNGASSVSSHLNAILQMWRSGSGSSLAGAAESNVRIKPVIDVIDADTLDVLLGTLDQQLTALSVPWSGQEADGGEAELASGGTSHPKLDERMTAAVWRYQFGVRLVHDERAPAFPAPDPLGDVTNTERQYLFKDWPDIETTLRSIFALLPSDPADFDPPLRPTDIILFTFPDKPLEHHPNVTLWASMDGNGDDAHPNADIGFAWAFPLEPVLPSILTEDYMLCIAACGGNNSACADICATASQPILGGTYPPNPVLPNDEPLNGRGVCSLPLSRDGYLCRPIDPTRSSIDCKEQPSAPNDTVLLTRCTLPTASGTTIAGPDTCSDSAWHDEPFDPQTQCRVTFTCGGACNGGVTGLETRTKAADGTINVCIGAFATLTRAVVLGELVHVEERCHQPPGWEPIESTATFEAQVTACCRSEGEAAQVLCRTLEDEGAFKNPPSSTLPITAESCAEALASRSCDQRGLSTCPSTQEIPAGFAAIIDGLIAQHTGASPLSCSQVESDQQITIAKETIERDDNVCTPGRTVRFANTVGNNLCYLGSCMEQSMETHWLPGGRQSFTVEGRAYPNSPTVGTSQQRPLFRGPSSKDTFLLPPYSPLRLVQAIENALCQINGMPALSPPGRCGSDQRRTLQAGGSSIESLLQSSAQPLELLTALSAQSMTEAMGIRVTGSLYEQYIQSLVAPLSNLLRGMADALAPLPTVSFPTNMCSLGPQ